MMGVTNDKAIAKYIMYDADDDSRISNEIWNRVLSEAFDRYPAKFQAIKNERDQNKILEFVGRLLMKKKTE
jgi:hypothetical protein